MRPVYLCILLFMSISAYAEVYKWSDEQGQSYYGDTPPSGAKNVQPTKLTANVIEVEKVPYEVGAAAKKNPVTLYAFAGCGEACKRAQALLDKRGVPYTLKSKEADKIELKRITGENKVPLLIVGKQTPRRGFEETAWNRMLDEAGYPKNNPLATLNKKPAAPAPSLAKPVPAATPASAAALLFI